MILNSFHSRISVNIEDAGFIQRPDLYKYLRLVENFQVECFEAVRTLNRTLINALEPNDVPYYSYIARTFDTRFEPQFVANF